MKNVKAWLMILSLLGFASVWADDAEILNINTASASALSLLEGIGPKKAQSIVDFREKHGNFNHVDDLDNVPGIGEKTIEKNRNRISVETVSTAEKSMDAGSVIEDMAQSIETTENATKPVRSNTNTQ